MRLIEIVEGASNNLAPIKHSRYDKYHIHNNLLFLLTEYKFFIIFYLIKLHENFQNKLFNLPT